MKRTLVTGIIIATYGLVYTWTALKPAKTIVGSIRYLDFVERKLSITTSPTQAIRCTFRNDYDVVLQGFKQGDAITAKLGLHPNLLMPICANYTLVSIEPTK
jgi:hypothetical protein